MIILTDQNKFIAIDNIKVLIIKVNEFQVAKHFKPYLKKGFPIGAITQLQNLTFTIKTSDNQMLSINKYMKNCGVFAVNQKGNIVVDCNNKRLVRLKNNRYIFKELLEPIMVLFGDFFIGYCRMNTGRYYYVHRTQIMEFTACYRCYSKRNCNF